MELTDRKNLLNRSISSPDVSMNAPICRRIYMEEFYYTKRNARRFTCEQTMDNDKYLQSNPHFGANFFENHFAPSTIQKFPSVSSLCLETSANLNDSPMDVDVETSQNNSLTELHDDDLSPQISSTPNILPNFHRRVKIEKDVEMDDVKSFIGAKTQNVLENCKVGYRGRVPVLLKKGEVKVEEVVKRSSFGVVRLLGVLLILCVSLYSVRYYDKTFYDRTINVSAIRSELEENVVNQEEQISQILEYFELVSSHRLNLPKNVLVFFGTNGVGKSFTVNLIKKHFKPSQVFDFDLTRDAIVVSDFHRNVPYLLILDNLRVSDLPQANKILKSLPNSQILPILIFNNQYLHDSGEFYVNSWEVDEAKKGISGDFVAHFVKFNSFDRAVLRGLVKNVREFEQVFEQHDFEGVGLKGFFGKVQLVKPDLKVLFK